MESTNIVWEFRQNETLFYSSLNSLQLLQAISTQNLTSDFSVRVRIGLYVRFCSSSIESVCTFPDQWKSFKWLWHKDNSRGIGTTTIRLSLCWEACIPFVLLWGPGYSNSDPAPCNGRNSSPWPLTCIWEIQKKLHAPGFGLAPLWLLCPVVGWTSGWDISDFLS